MTMTMITTYDDDDDDDDDNDDDDDDDDDKTCQMQWSPNAFAIHQYLYQTFCGMQDDAIWWKFFSIEGHLWFQVLL